MQYISIVATWMIVMFVFTLNPKNKAVIWCSFFVFLCGLGFATSINWGFMPYYNENFSKSFNENILLLHNIVSGISHFLGPLTYMFFTIEYSNILCKQKNIKNLLYLVFSIPWFLMFCFFPITNFTYFYYGSNVFWQALRCLIFPYFLISSTFLLYSFIKEYNMRIKKQKFLACMFFIPMTLAVTFVSYINGNYGFQFHYGLIFWPFAILLFAITYLFFALKYGFMGLKIRVERFAVDASIKKMSKGVEMFIHTLNREIGVIKACANNIERETKNPESLKDIEIMMSSIYHIHSILNRTNDTVKDFEIDKKPNNISSLVDRAVKGIENLAFDKNANIKTVVESDAFILCDEAHIVEVLRNILKNSIEAISLNGQIIILIYENRGNAVISIKDNGSGIPEDCLPHIFDFYFTTKGKQGNANYGLGLYYCYNIINLHKASIDIQSKEGVGTTVFLSFPVVKISSGKEKVKVCQK